MSRYRAADLSAYPLWKLIRARRQWLRAGNADLVALANRAIEARIGMIGSAPA